MRIGKQYSFAAAHRLTGVPKSHPCASLHGHNYIIEVEAEAPIDRQTGMVMDFHALDEHVKPLIGQLDHTLLNDHNGLANPTAENIAMWLLQHMSEPVSAIKVWETDKCWAMADRERTKQ